MSQDSTNSPSLTRDPTRWGTVVEATPENATTDYRVETVCTEKVLVYRSIHHWVNLLAEVAANHPTPAMSCTLTGLCYLFPALIPRNAAFVLPVNSPDAGVKSRSRIVQMAFIAACHLVKPITAENRPYLNKRWNAGIASVIGGQALIAPFESSPVIEEVIANCCPELHNHVSPREIVSELLKEIPEVFPILCRAMRAQLALVFQRAGMVAVEFMYSYCTAPANAAITIRAVWSQVVEFVELYRRAKQNVESRYPGGWLYARSLCEDALLPLAASKFPDLYYTAIKTAKREGQLDARQFILSDRGEGGSRLAMDRLIRVRVTQVQAGGSEEFSEAMRKVGIDPAAFLVSSRSQKRSRRHDRSSSES